MRRLIAAGLLPERAGQPVRAWVHVSLAELRGMDDGSVLAGEWITGVRARWAAHRAAASVVGGDGAAWLQGDAARGLACEARLYPVVTGEVDPGVLDDLVDLCVELAGHGHGCWTGTGPADPGQAGRHPAVGPDPAGPGQAQAPAGDPAAGPDPAGAGDPVPATAADPSAAVPGQIADQPAGCGCRGGAGPRPLTAHAREMLERAVIGKAADLLSGPGGLASFLRRQQLGRGLAGPSLPLDIGYSGTIPAGIRRAVLLRDQHCQWPGGCHQPAAACEVHHVRHQADGGPTSVHDCILLCTFHHRVVIHRWGWTLLHHPDGTTTAWNKNRTKVLHSHGPPARAG